MKTAWILRVGIAAVFLWFGVSELVNPEQFLAYAPGWTGLSPSTIVLVNGVFETVLGVLLLVGVYPSVVASLLLLHMVGIIASLGYNEVAVRDVGISVALLVIALNGGDEYSLVSLHD